MTQVKFTRGEVVRITPAHLNLTLFNGEAVVYKSTLSNKQAALIIDEYKNITMPEISHIH